MSPIDRYHAAVARTDALIEGTPTPVGKSAAEIRARAEERLARTRAFLAFRGNPHERYPIVHVGGTSGKGSTSAALAAILTAAGYRTGLHTSPYLQVATEKLQLDGRLIAPDAFADLVDDVLAGVEAWRRAGGAPLTYGEVWVALVAEWFARERVDAAVIEVGAGGRFDLTNVVRPAVSVITSVGLDHTVTLGATIPEIAWHKAGIIKPGAPVVTAVTRPDALAPIVAEARATGSPLIRVVPGETFVIPGPGESGLRWREVGAGGRPGAEFETLLPGRFQVANAATAVAAARALADRGLPVSETAVRAGLRSPAVRLPGRTEVVQDRPRVVLDGAHNPEKMAALADELGALVPRAPGGRLVAVVGVLEGKDAWGVLGALLPRVDELIATAPRVLAKPAASAERLAAVARNLGFAGTIVANEDPEAAVAHALRRASVGRGDALLVTGSLYLIGNVRGRWYPADLILSQQTPWPERAPPSHRPSPR